MTNYVESIVHSVFPMAKRILQLIPRSASLMMPGRMETARTNMINQWAMLKLTFVVFCPNISCSLSVKFCLEFFMDSLSPTRVFAHLNGQLFHFDGPTPIVVGPLRPRPVGQAQTRCVLCIQSIVKKRIHFFPGDILTRSIVVDSVEAGEARDDCHLTGQRSVPARHSIRRGRAKGGGREEGARLRRRRSTAE